MFQKKTEKPFERVKLIKKKISNKVKEVESVKKNIKSLVSLNVNIIVKEKGMFPTGVNKNIGKVVMDINLFLEKGNGN